MKTIFQEIGITLRMIYRIIISRNVIVITETNADKENQRHHFMSSCCCEHCKMALLETSFHSALENYEDSEESEEQALDEIEEILKQANITKN
jgi:hypothetical protein